MKKLTQKQLLDLAAAIGLEGVELVDDEAQSEFDLDTALSTVDGNRRKILEPTLRQELEESAKSAAEGRVLGGIRAMLARNTGLSHSKLKEFGEDKMEDAIKAAIQHKISQVEGATEDTTKKIEEMLTAWNKEKEEILATEQKKYNDLNEKYVRRDMLGAVKGKLKDAPLPEKLDRDIAAEDFMNHLMTKYHLSFNEAEKAVALMDKTNPAIPALNEAKNAQIDILSEAKAFFEPRNNWVTDMRNVNPAERMNNLNGNRPNLPNAQVNTGRKTPAQLREERLAGYKDAPPVV